MRYRTPFAALLAFTAFFLFASPTVLYAYDHEMHNGGGQLPGDPEGGLYAVPIGSSSGFEGPPSVRVIPSADSDKKWIDILGFNRAVSCFANWYQTFRHFEFAALNGKKVPNACER
jgi:hypothetical protein